MSINVDTLMQPISQAAPAGEDLRYTDVYERIKEARRFDAPLTQGAWQTDIKTADWKRVIALCCDALANRSKDLQIVSWLTEALLNRKGFQGLSEGLQLTARLLFLYWETLFPAMEDGDPDYRVGPLAFLDEKMPQALVMVPLCDPVKTKGYTYFHWEESRTVQEVKGKKEPDCAPADDDAVSAESFAAAVNLSPIGFYRQLREDLNRCRSELSALEVVVDEKFSADPPGFTRIGKTLENCLRVVERIYREKQKSEVSRQEDMEIIHKPEETEAAAVPAPDDTPFPEPPPVPDEQWLMSRRAISDISGAEKSLWRQVAGKLSDGQLKSALDQLLAAASLAPSIREKNRHLLLVAKLCLKAERSDLALPIVEGLYELIESLNLEQWEHPAWIADVVETLYRCLSMDGDNDSSERTRQLFRKLCTLNITKAAAYRID
jgi:type VI secretion system protein ImpA